MQCLMHTFRFTVFGLLFVYMCCCFGIGKIDGLVVTGRLVIAVAGEAAVEGIPRNPKSSLITILAIRFEFYGVDLPP